MEWQDLFVLVYITAREGCLSFFRLYAFKGCLRFPVRVIVFVLSLIICAEYTCYFLNGREISVPILYLFPLFCFLFCLAAVKVHINKQIFIYFTLAHFSMLFQSLAFIAEDLYGAVCFPPYFLAASVSVICLGALFRPLCLIIKKYRRIWLQTKSQKVIFMVNVILTANLAMSVILRDFSRPRSWYLFTERLINILPILLFTYLVLYLLEQIDDNRRMYDRLNLMKKLRASEKHYYNHVIETWKSSRRLRHDLRHHALLLKEYTENKQYDRLTDYISTFLQHDKLYREITLCGNETVDGIVGYWRMQAKECGIDFSCNIKIEKIHVDDVDLAVILGNSLENAFFAARKLPAADRFINLKITTKNSLLLINLQNSFNRRIVIKNNTLYSGRNNFKTAGIGTENIKMTVRKYNGYVDFKTRGNVFILHIAVENRA